MCSSDASLGSPAGPKGGKQQRAAAGPGKDLSSHNCGSCHTLKAAGTGGSVALNLDQLKPEVSRVLAAIKNGGTDHHPGCMYRAGTPRSGWWRAEVCAAIHAGLEAGTVEEDGAGCLSASIARDM